MNLIGTKRFSIRRVLWFLATAVILVTIWTPQGFADVYYYAYGLGPGEFFLTAIEVRPEHGIEFLNLRNEDVNVRVCLYEGDCPDTRIVGGPNPGEIGCTECRSPDPTRWARFTTTTCLAGKQFAAYICANDGDPPLVGLPTEGNEGETVMPDYPCEGVPALTDTGIVALVVVLLLSSLWLYRKKRAHSTFEGGIS